MWRVDAGHRVFDVAVALFTRGMWGCGDGHYETTPVAAVRAWAFRNSVMGAILAPGEPTRAEILAQLDEARRSPYCATLSAHEHLRVLCAERKALRERAEEHHRRGDEARHEAAMMRQELDEICGYALRLLLEVAQKVPVREELGAAEGETLLAAAKRVMRQHVALVRDVDAMRAAARAAGWNDADATGENLVEWVRRGEREAVARQESKVVECYNALVAAAKHAGLKDAEGATPFDLVIWARSGAVLRCADILRSEAALAAFNPDMQWRGQLACWANGTDTVVAYDEYDARVIAAKHRQKTVDEIGSMRRVDDNDDLRVPDDVADRLGAPSDDGEGTYRPRKACEWARFCGHGFLFAKEV